MRLLEKHEDIDYEKMAFVAQGLLELGQTVQKSNIHSPLKAI